MAQCINCRESKRLTTFSSLNCGDHIYLGGYNSLYNFKSKQVAFYNHHALVKKVEHNKGSSAILTLVHFTSTPYDKHILLRETTELKDLHYDEIYVVKYRHKQFPADHVMNTAESLLESACVYSLVLYNCEHFCNLCCTKSYKSVQVENVTDTVQYLICTLALILMILNIKGTLNVWHWFNIFFFLFILTLISLFIHSTRGYFCHRAFLYRLVNFLCRYFIYYCSLLLFSGDTSDSMHVSIAVRVAAFVLTMALVLAVPKLTNKLFTPFKGFESKSAGVNVKSLDEINQGDVITFAGKFGISYNYIVSEIKKTSEKSSINGDLTVICYTPAALFFGKWKISEYTIHVDLTKDSVEVHYYCGYTVNEPDEVLHRAKQRIGETKFNLFSNRSCHFCHWAKVKEDTDLDDEPQTQKSLTRSNADHDRANNNETCTLEVTCALRRDDVKEGQVIQFVYASRQYKAVCTKVGHNETFPSRIYVTVRYGKINKVVEETFPFDLWDDDIYIYKHVYKKSKKTELVFKEELHLQQNVSNLLQNNVGHDRARIHATMALEVACARRREDVKSGQIIQFTYSGLQHIAICTKVRYNLPQMCITVVQSEGNTAVENTFLLSHNDISICNYQFKNRTQQHLSSLCQINVDHDRARQHATQTLETSCPRIGENVKAGQIVQFNRIGLPHKAVITKVASSIDCPSKLSFTVVHYGKENTVVEETFKFDLRHDDIKIYNYHPIYRYNEATVIQQARARADIGEKSYNYFTRSSQLAKEIVQKDRYKRICQQKQIHRGDVIFCRLLKHDAVVTAVSRDVAAVGNTLIVSIIHYAAPENIVKEEIITRNIESPENYIYVKHFAGYCTYPENVTAMRAMSRIDEQRFSSYDNTSNDLAHWAKVVQTPAIVNYTLKNKDSTLQNKDALLVPRIGKQYDQFQGIAVYAWSDLTEGSIVEYQHHWLWYTGILTKSDEDKSKITVCQFRRGGFCFIERSVNTYEKKLNLKSDTIWIYRCHPINCRTQEDILRRASDGDKLFWGGGSWDFSKWCVLKPEIKAERNEKLDKFVQVPETDENETQMECE